MYFFGKYACKKLQIKKQKHIGEKCTFKNNDTKLSMHSGMGP